VGIADETMNIGRLNEVLDGARRLVERACAEVSEDLEAIQIAKSVWFLSCVEAGCVSIEQSIERRVAELLGRKPDLPGRYDPSRARDLDEMLTGFIEHLRERGAALEGLTAELRALAIERGPDSSDLEALASELELITKEDDPAA